MWEIFVGQAKIVFVYFPFFSLAFDTVFENVPQFFLRIFFLSALKFTGCIPRLFTV